MGEDNLGELNYAPFARRYAQGITNNLYNASYERPATLSLLPDVKGLRILDAGCGPGIYSAWLISHGAIVTAIDATLDFVQMTIERTKQKAIVFQWDLEDRLSFAEENSYDLILCPLVMDYIKNWRPVFQEFYRILKYEGSFIFSCGHPASNFYRNWPDDNYFEVDLHEMEWKGFGEPNPRIKSYRRSLQNMINPLIDSGFILDRILEPQPPSDFPRNPETEDVYQDLMRQPWFLHIRARKHAI